MIPESGAWHSCPYFLGLFERFRDAGARAARPSRDGPAAGHHQQGERVAHAWRALGELLASAARAHEAWHHNAATT